MVYEAVLYIVCVVFFFFFKQKTAYEMRISDWSSDVCSSDLPVGRLPVHQMCVRKIVHAFMIRTMATSDEVFDAIVRIAIEAGEKIMAIYRGEFAVTRKNDDSPLTQADLAAHRHILAALHALTPDLPVLSGEAADIPYPTPTGRA